MALHVPAENDLFGRHSRSLCYRDDVPVFGHGRQGHTQRGICRDNNSLLLAESDKVAILIVWMRFNLVHRRHNLGVLQKLCQCFHAEVTDAYALNLASARLQKLFHSFPCFNIIDRVI